MIDLRLGDCVEVMRGMDANSVDSIVTDPPYGLEFMGKEWDRLWNDKAFGADNHLPTDENGVSTGLSRWSIARPQYKAGAEAEAWHFAWASEALRVAKPGALLLAFGGTRTWHRLACAIEDAGWEIRDTVCWLYGSGFPKSHDISKAIDKAAGAEREVVGPKMRPDGKAVIDARRNGFDGQHEGYDRPWKHDREAVELQASITAPATPLASLWSGWGTALKPAFEPVIVAMKPLDGTFAQNAERHGVAGLWVDGSRIEAAPGDVMGNWDKWREDNEGMIPNNTTYAIAHNPKAFTVQPRCKPSGRWPANVILDEDAAALLDEQSGEREPGRPQNRYTGGDKFAHKYNHGLPLRTGWDVSPSYTDTGGASRFFYCAKASRSEREAGLEGMEETRFEVANHGMTLERWPDGTLRERVTERQTASNVHPCVKPLALMRYLVRLCKTPTGGLVLDPFMGSGTTGCAAVLEGRDFIGIEKDAGYMAIAQRRIDAAQMQGRLL